MCDIVALVGLKNQCPLRKKLKFMQNFGSNEKGIVFVENIKIASYGIELNGCSFLDSGQMWRTVLHTNSLLFFLANLSLVISKLCKHQRSIFKNNANFIKFQ